ncbi:MAG: phosphotransferase family protein [Actinobacteria bacterium]|nr:phosphotransferase family protein [Actinomycetota bacterium]
MADAGTTSIDGIDVANVTAWMVEHAGAVDPPLEFGLIQGGHSNLTFDVRDQADGHWVLRRPPLKQVLATAHDMGREHRIICALQPTPVPVPPVVGLCTDDAVNGAPFYVMGFVEGEVIRDAASAGALSSEQRRVAGGSIIDVLADIHAVDIDAAGLGDFAKRDDYIGRQLSRWYGQFEKSKTRDVPVVDEVHDRLTRFIPEQGPATIVHGDYRLDNCLVGADSTVAAVLDWEICTLGDPLADLGLLLVYWGDRDDPSPSRNSAPTTLDGFPTPHDVLQRYAERSGRDVSQIDYYVAFGFWKLACIVEGVYARYVGGAMGKRDDTSFEFFGQQVITLAEAAREAMGRVE